MDDRVLIFLTVLVSLSAILSIGLVLSRARLRGRPVRPLSFLPGVVGLLLAGACLVAVLV